MKRIRILANVIHKNFCRLDMCIKVFPPYILPQYMDAAKPRKHFSSITHGMVQSSAGAHRYTDEWQCKIPK